MNRPGRVKERDIENDDAEVGADVGGGGTNEQDVLFGILIVVLILGGMYLLASCTGNNPTGRISNFITGSDDSATVETEDATGDDADTGTSVAGNTTIPLPAGTSDATMELTGTGIRLSGTVGSNEVRDQIVTEAAAVFGPDGVEDGLVVDDNFTDEGGRISVTGVVDSDAARNAAAALGENAARNTPLSVENLTTLPAPEGSEDDTTAEATTTTASGDDSGDAASEGSVTTDSPAVADSTDDSTGATGDSTGIAAPDTTSPPPAPDTTAAAATSGDSAPATADNAAPAISRPEQAETTTTAAIPSTTTTVVNPAEVASKLTDLSRQSDVLFEYNSATLSGSAVSTLDQIVAVLQESPTVNVEIAGHTDAVGPAGRNERLSQERADSVRAYLVGRGVAGERLVSRGYGESQPVASSETEEGRIANRRIEFNVLG